MLKINLIKMITELEIWGVTTDIRNKIYKQNWQNKQKFDRNKIMIKSVGNAFKTKKYASLLLMIMYSNSVVFYVDLPVFGGE